MDFFEPTAFDIAVRRMARRPLPRRLGRVMLPLYPLGMPGGYLTVAYYLAHRLKRRGRAGGAQIIASAWLGWWLHRAMKMAIKRRRPGTRGERGQIESFPSGHTSGATALAFTAACVLYREGELSRDEAIALAVAAPLVMGGYRVLDDEHWATDVVGGWLLGGAISTGLAMTLPRRPRLVRRGRPRYAA